VGVFKIGTGGHYTQTGNLHVSAHISGGLVCVYLWDSVTQWTYQTCGNPNNLIAVQNEGRAGIRNWLNTQTQYGLSASLVAYVAGFLLVIWLIPFIVPVVALA
jgi:hypothetical protein